MIFLTLSRYPHAGRRAIRLVSGGAARSGRDDPCGNTVRSRLRAADRRGLRLFSHAFDPFWSHRIRLGLPGYRWRRGTGASCRRRAGVSADNAARRRGVFQSRSRIIRRNAPYAGSIEGWISRSSGAIAGLVDPGAPPPTAPAGGPPPTLPAGAPPSTAALPMPAAPTPAPVAPAPVPPPEPAPPPAPTAKPVGNAASNTANAKVLGMKRVIVCSIVETSTEPG